MKEGFPNEEQEFKINYGSDDFYERLGLSQNASMDEIKAAYRTEAKKTHPDLVGDDSKAEDFKNISEAYSVLIDPEKRDEYDRFGFWNVRDTKNSGDTKKSAKAESKENAPRENNSKSASAWERWFNQNIAPGSEPPGNGSSRKEAQNEPRVKGANEQAEEKEQAVVGAYWKIRERKKSEFEQQKKSSPAEEAVISGDSFEEGQLRRELGLKAQQSARDFFVYVKVLRGPGAVAHIEEIADPMSYHNVILREAQLRVAERGAAEYDRYISEWKELVGLDRELIDQSSEVRNAVLFKMAEEAREGPSNYARAANSWIRAHVLSSINELSADELIVQGALVYMSRLSPELKIQAAEDWKKCGIDFSAEAVDQKI